MELFISSEDNHKFIEVKNGRRKCLNCSSNSFHKYCKVCYSTHTECAELFCKFKCKLKFCSEECYYKSRRNIYTNNKRQSSSKICLTKRCNNISIHDLCSICHERMKNFKPSRKKFNEKNVTKKSVTI